MNWWAWPWRARKQLSRDLPAIQLQAKPRPGGGSFVDPLPWMEAQAFNEAGTLVGRVNFGVSPVNDRIYVDGLHVEKDFRRRGYARSMLAEVAKLASSGNQQLPITALHEVPTSRGFWQGLRAGEVKGLVVTLDVRAGDMEAERERWRGGRL